MLCVPVRCAGHTVGMVVLHSKEAFSQAEKTFIQRVLDMFGGLFQRDLTVLALEEHNNTKAKSNAFKSSKSKSPSRGAPAEAKGNSAYVSKWQLVSKSQLGVAHNCALVSNTFMSTVDMVRAERAAGRLQAMQRARQVRLQVPQRRVLVQNYGAKAASRILDSLQQWHNTVDDTEALGEALITKIVPLFDAAKAQWTATSEVTVLHLLRI